MGYRRPASFTEAVETWKDFERVYEEYVAHATNGTGHETPQNHEISEFLRFIATQDDDVIESRLETDQYRPLVGWRNEWPIVGEIELEGHLHHVEGYAEANQNGGLERDGPDDLWNSGYFESWKDAYRDHIETDVERDYELTDLAPSDVEPLIEDLTETATISTPIPSYMLGGRQGGIIWSGFKDRSLEEPEEAAAVLSYLFDEDDHVNLRLDRFGSFYGDLDDGGGQLMSLATILLTFVHPRDYVFYKWSLMRDFFGEFSDYSVGTGFDTDQYWKLNAACKQQILSVLDEHLEEATMLDVHTILYVYSAEYAEA